MFNYQKNASGEEKGAHKSFYGSRESLEESRPATTRIEFSIGFIERGSTTTTVVDPISKELVIFPCASPPAFTQY